MKKGPRRILLGIIEIFDVAVVVGCFVLVALLFNKPDVLIFKSRFLPELMQFQVADILWLILLSFLWRNIFLWSGFYKSKRLTSIRVEIWHLVLVISFCSATTFLLGKLFNSHEIFIRFLIVFWFSASMILIAFRLVLRWMLKIFRLANRNLRYVLIVGTNKRAIEFAKKIALQPALGYRLIGFADDDWEGANDSKKEGCRCVCDLKGIFDYLRNCVVDEVYLALPLNSYYEWSSKLVNMCEELGIVIRYPLHPYNLKRASVETDQIEDSHLVSPFSYSQWGWRQWAKRLFDILCSCFGLCIAGLPMILIATLIKLTSQGPVFYIQERIGFNKRRFKMIKFRTMIDKAEDMQDSLQLKNEVSGPVFKIKNDPRITPLGRFLRKTSIDELPQLVNVLKGDMSIVGPRPLPVREYGGFDQDRHRRRLSVLPGMTCIWQINGRNNIPFEKWMEMDMKYIDSWTLILDLKLFFRTIVYVIRGIGAS
jgi:exopolysaccharide biosynthesis polyprenyl glycosylphosphotransferase